MEFTQVQACIVQQYSNIMVKLHLMVPFIGGKNRLASVLIRVRNLEIETRNMEQGKRKKV